MAGSGCAEAVRATQLSSSTDDATTATHHQTTLPLPHPLPSAVQCSNQPRSTSSAVTDHRNTLPPPRPPPAVVQCGNQFELVGSAIYLAFANSCPTDVYGHARKSDQQWPRGITLYTSVDFGQSFSQACLPVALKVGGAGAPAG